jgi:hypothetical protein
MHDSSSMDARLFLPPTPHPPAKTASWPQLARVFACESLDNEMKGICSLVDKQERRGLIQD